MVIFSLCLIIFFGFIEMHELFFKDEVWQLDVTLLSTVIFIIIAMPSLWSLHKCTFKFEKGSSIFISLLHYTDHYITTLYDCRHKTLYCVYNWNHLSEELSCQYSIYQRSHKGSIDCTIVFLKFLKTPLHPNVTHVGPSPFYKNPAHLAPPCPVSPAPGPYCCI